MSSNEDVKSLKICLQDISMATNGFANANIIAKGGFGNVYKGESEKHGRIAVKQLNRELGQGDPQFQTEITLLSKYKHENIVSLIGFCDEDGEKIIVYKYENNESLDKHVGNKDLNWIQRLLICLDVARGLHYLLDDVVSQQPKVIHRDVKSSNILLDTNWNAKISDFGLSKEGTANMKSFVISNPCGTNGYMDPDYCVNGYLTPKTDVFSFGVVLWEVLCGRLAYDIYKDEGLALYIFVQKHYINGTLHKIIPSYLYKQINTNSLSIFSNIAYQCLKYGHERPKIPRVMEQLQEALQLQVLSCCTSPDQESDEEDGKVEGKEEETTTEEEKKGKEPEEMPQEIVLRLFMHCEECARKVRQCLQGFQGVEHVHTDCETRKVVVKGNKADPLKVLERVQKKIHRNVELLSPLPKPPTEEQQKPEQKTPPPRQEEKKHELPQVISVILKVYMHCEGCVQDITKSILKMEGVESVIADQNNSQVAVKGTISVEKLVNHVKRKTRKNVEILKQDQ